MSLSTYAAHARAMSTAEHKPALSTHHSPRAPLAELEPRGGRHVDVLERPEAALGTVSLVSSHARNPILRITIYNSSHLILDKVARILTSADVKWAEQADRRHERTGYAIHFSTSSALLLYDALRPHMVRHANRYDAAYFFMESRGVRPGRRRRWSDRDRDVWDNLRAVLNAR